MSYRAAAADSSAADSSHAEPPIRAEPLRECSENPPKNCRCSSGIFGAFRDTACVF